VVNVEAKMSAYLKCRSLPSLYKKGVYRIGFNSLDEIDQKMSDFEQEWKESVEKFVTVYPQKREQTMNLLREIHPALADPKDYPVATEIASWFSFRYEFLPDLGTPDARLESISPEIYRREKEKAEKRMVEYLSEARAILRGMVQELCNEMLARVQPAPEGGRAKIFRKEVIEGFDQFFKTFSDLNVTNDDTLKGLVDRAKEVLAEGGYRESNNDDSRDRIASRVAANIRDDETIKASIRSTFSEIKGTLDQMVEDAPLRAMAALED
jgi:hypothetical protein